MKTFGVFHTRLERDNFLLEAKKDKRKDCCKAFEQTQTFTPTEHDLLFLKWDKCLWESDGEQIEQLLT